MASDDETNTPPRGPERQGSGKAEPGSSADKEARLAAALRANLRRRKAASKSQA